MTTSPQPSEAESWPEADLDGSVAGPDQESLGRWEALDEPVRRRRGSLWLPLGILCVLALLAAGGGILAQRCLLPARGTIVGIERGSLLVDDDGDGSFGDALVGHSFGEGALLKASPGTSAMVELPAGARFRIESAGEWQILTLRASLSEHRSQSTVHQLWGVATYLSRPPQEGVQADLAVQSMEAALSLVGVATAATTPGESTSIQLLDGEGRVRAGQADLALQRAMPLVINAETGAVEPG